MRVQTLGLFGNFGWQELLLLAVVGILLFGKRLPEVGRSLGRGIVEFKKGLSGVEEEIKNAGSVESKAPGQIENKAAGPSVDTTEPQKQPAEPPDQSDASK